MTAHVYNFGSMKFKKKNRNFCYPNFCLMKTFLQFWFYGNLKFIILKRCMELTPSRWKGNTVNESNNLRMNNPDLKRVVTYEKKKTLY